MNHNSTIDLLIIGAGPAGLSCAIEAGKSGLKSIVIDRGAIAHSIQRFQRDMFFFSTPELLQIGEVPFIVPTTRPTSLDCVNYYCAVVQHYQIVCRFYEAVTALDRQDAVFIARTSRGNEIRSRSVVIASGYYDTPNLLNVPGEDLPHVSHYYRDPLPYFGQEVLIIGGKNSAVEAALDLWRHGAKVMVVHRGPALSTGVKYWILPDFENRVSGGSIVFHRGCHVLRFLPSSTIVTDSNGTTMTIRNDFVFVLTGYRPDLDFLRSAGISIDEESLAPRFNPVTMETNVPGLYVAGGLVGGRYNNRVFIENGREHAKLIIPSIIAQT